MDTDEKHLQLMQFMTAFKLSIENIEGNIKDTNRKIDKKLEHIDKELEGMKEKIDDNQKHSDGVLGRMDARLNMLENEMKDYNKKEKKLDGGRRLEIAAKPAEKTADEKLRNQTQRNGGRKMTTGAKPAEKTDDDDRVKFRKQKKFNRNVVNQEDLVRNVEIEAVDIVEMDPLTTEATPYHSTWAQDVEEEYGGRAGQAGLVNRETWEWGQK